MAVTVNDRYIRAVATSGQTVFTYDFPISENANIVILNIDSAGTVTTLTYAVDYTLTGVGTSSGTYVLTSGATSGDIYIAYGNTPYARTSDFAGKTEVTTAAINNQYDDLEKQIQQLRRDALRAISAPISDNAASIDFTLDAAADRGGKYMKFSSDGYSIEMDGGTGGSASAGGSNGQIQYNNAGALGGDTSTTDGAGNINVTTINIGSTTAITGFIDDDGMTTASATTVASSESIKAYVDSNTGGDVAGPASSTDNAVARYDGASGKIVQDSGVLISDTDVVSGITQLNVDNIRIDGNTISSTDTNGNVTVTPNGTGVFDLGNSTEAMQMPSGTTAQRPSSPVAGYVRFNTTTSTLETWDGSQWITQSGGSGDVTGPGSSTDNAVVRFDGTGGTLLQDSGVLISDTDAVSGLASLNINSTTTVNGVIDDDTMATASATTLATSESIVAYIGTQTRETLTADRTYYVRTDGNDANNGLTNTSGGAFLTIQHAVNVAATLDMGGYNLTIQVGDGTYSESVNLLSYTGGTTAGYITIQGNSTTPTNVVVSGGTGYCFNTNNSRSWLIKDLQVTNTGSLEVIRAFGNETTIHINNVDFGAATSTYHMRAQANANISITTNYTISGGAIDHIRAQTGGVINLQNFTCTVSGTPAFSGAFARATIGGTIYRSSGSYSGSATGIMYSVNNVSVIDVNSGGTSFFPGGTGGSEDTATSGHYIA